MVYAVSQRTQEMGIRLALGASPSSLLNMILGQGMTLTAIGLAIGLALALGAFGSIGAVRTLLPGISPLDPITFITVPLTLTLIAFLATWIPGRRAGKVDPLIALRVISTVESAFSGWTRIIRNEAQPSDRLVLLAALVNNPRRATRGSSSRSHC